MNKPFPTLQEILQYKNDDLIERYKRDYPNNKLSAEDALREILKFLWAGQLQLHLRAEQPDNEDLKFAWTLHAEMAEIDDMWHTFILFTKEYREFCNRYFGKFIDHSPKTESDKKSISENFEEFLTVDTQRQLSFLYDHLGEETLQLWFAEYLKQHDGDAA